MCSGKPLSIRYFHGFSGAKNNLVIAKNISDTEEYEKQRK
jgi:hypothetical protein